MNSCFDINTIAFISIFANKKRKKILVVKDLVV